MAGPKAKIKQSALPTDYKFWREADNLKPVLVRVSAEQLAASHPNENNIRSKGSCENLTNGGLPARQNRHRRFTTPHNRYIITQAITEPPHAQLTLRAILDGHPQSGIEDLMPWRFNQPSSLAA